MARPRVLVHGATGLTGNAIARGMHQSDEVELVACVAPSLSGDSPSREVPDVLTASSLNDLPEQTAASIDVVIDFSTASAVATVLDWAVTHACDTLVGTTGMDEETMLAYGEQFDRQALRLVIASNCSIAAVMCMDFAARLATHYPDIEIVETHRSGKLDAPSGTAVSTARKVAAARGSAKPANSETNASRGAYIDGVPVHSLRMPGAVAHQETIVSGAGEMVTIRHDAIDRSCYVPGAIMVATGMKRLPAGITMGLEALL